MTSTYNPEYITEADIDDRPRWFGQPVTEDDLLDLNTWISEFNANICCTGYSRSDCGCGGWTGDLPSEASRLILEHYQHDEVF